MNRILNKSKEKPKISSATLWARRYKEKYGISQSTAWARQYRKKNGISFSTVRARKYKEKHGVYPGKVYRKEWLRKYQDKNGVTPYTIWLRKMKEERPLDYKKLKAKLKAKGNKDIAKRNAWKNDYRKRKSLCEICKSKDKLEFHHTNYAKHLGLTLCRGCHRDIHRDKGGRTKYGI